MKILVLMPLLLNPLAWAFTDDQCGPQHGNQVCKSGKCCSDHGWCDVGPAYCDPKTCQKNFSGKGSSCAGSSVGSSSSASSSCTAGQKSATSSRITVTVSVPTSTSTHATTPSSSSTPKASSSVSRPSSMTTKVQSSSSAYSSVVPNIDVCGSGPGGISCPGAGANGYFYRCCSDQGHCGPKNNIQDQALYCGKGCQAGYGNCETNRPKPPNPTGTPGVAQNGETCGPIVNKKCAAGLCCSGSNYCGTGSSFCGAANWCQSSWGKCS